MAGQIWSVPAEGGFLYSDELSTYLRSTAQPRQKFRQLCDSEDGSQKGLNRGEKFTWDVYSNLGTRGRDLDERLPIPETGFTLTQASLTVTEAGISVPLSGKLMMLAKHDIEAVIDKTLRNDCVKYHDTKAFLQFKSSPLVVAPTGGASVNSVTLSTNGSTAITNNVAMGAAHIKAVSDLMKERNIPSYAPAGDDYIAIGRPTAFRGVKNDMEALKQYTETGLAHIFNGEIGRYEGFRFVEQTNIPTGGPIGSTTFDPWTDTPAPWTNGKSDWCFFCGGDTVTEATVVLEEIRAKLPGDYGRARGMAWYYLGGYGLVHSNPTDARVIRWDSAA